VNGPGIHLVLHDVEEDELFLGLFARNIQLTVRADLAICCFLSTYVNVRYYI